MEIENVIAKSLTNSCGKRVELGEKAGLGSNALEVRCNNRLTYCVLEAISLVQCVASLQVCETIENVEVTPGLPRICVLEQQEAVPSCGFWFFPQPFAFEIGRAHV